MTSPAEPTPVGAHAPVSAPYILKFFAFDHLPVELRGTSQAFSELAHLMADTLPPSAELSAGLRKLLEAKDCMVRAHVDTVRMKG